MFGQFPAHQQSTYFNQYGNDGDYDDDEEGTIPLEEDIDSNYDPSEEEIIEYAEYLGMDPRIDREFFYIAREGLKAPLPKPWRAMRNSKGEIFYVNEATRQTTFVHPCDEFYKNEFTKVKQRQQQKKFNSMNHNQQSRDKQSDIYGNNNQNSQIQKLQSQLGSLKPKGVLSNINNNSFQTEKKNMSTNRNNYDSASKNISLINQANQSNSKQFSAKNDSFYNNESLTQSKFQNNDSTTKNKNDMQQQSSFKGQNQSANEVFIFDEQNGYDISSNVKSRSNSMKKNSDQIYYDDNVIDGQNQMRTSLNNNSNIMENTDSKKAPLYSQESDVMNDEMIDEEIHFFENYLKKQYQNQTEENEKGIAKIEKEYQQKYELDQLKQKNKRDEIEDEKNRIIKDNSRKLGQMKEKLRKEKYNELISDMEKQIKQIKTQHDQNIENINKCQKEDQQYEIEQYKTDKENQYKFKIEESKRRKQENEEFIKNNRDKIEEGKKKLKLKFEGIEIDLQIQEVQKLEQADYDIKLEFAEQQNQYLQELKEEENRIYKLINTDEKQLQKEIFQKKIQIKDLYQRKYDFKKSEELNKIYDKLRQFHQQEEILLDERIKKEEQEFIKSLMKLKMKEPEIKHQNQLNELIEKYKQNYNDIKHRYIQKMKNDEIIGLKRINDLRTELEKQNQSILNQQHQTTGVNKFDKSAISVQQEKVLEELYQNINLKKQDLKLAKQQQKQMQEEINQYQLKKDLFEYERKEDYLVQKSAEKQDMMDSYAKMLSYTQTKQFQYSQNLLNSYSKNKSTNKKNQNNQQKNFQNNYHSHPSKAKDGDDYMEDEDQPITTFLHQNLQQIMHMKQNNNEINEDIQINENEQNNPQQSNRVVFPDDDSDDDFHDSFSQEQQREKYMNDYENIRNQMNKAPHGRDVRGEEADQDEEQNQLPMQRQDLSCYKSRNGAKQQFIDNQQCDQQNIKEQSGNINQLDEEDPLIQFLDEEWIQIDNLKEELRFDKIIIKKSYEYLQLEKNKNLPLHQENQLRIKTMKNKLQQLADAFNEDVKITRENQKYLQIREEILYSIEEMLQKENFTQKQLSSQIDKYQKSVVEYIYPLLNQKIKQFGDLTKGNLSIEELLQKTFEIQYQNVDSTQNYDQSKYQTQYKQQIDKQMELYELEKQFIKEENNIYTQSRKPSKYQNFLYSDAEQLEQIFQEHTNWLKNMKNQLNQDLFTNRFQNISARRNMTNPQQDNLNQKMQAAHLLTKRIGNMNVLNL